MIRDSAIAEIENENPQPFRNTKRAEKKSILGAERLFFQTDYRACRQEMHAFGKKYERRLNKHGSMREIEKSYRVIALEEKGCVNKFVGR